MANKRLIDVFRLVIDLAKAKRYGVIDYEELMAIIASQKTVEAVEVVHARWEDEYGGAFANPRYRCSACKEKSLYRHERDCLGGWHEVQALTDYCPNCGAKMDGGNEDG